MFYIINIGQGKAKRLMGAVPFHQLKTLPIARTAFAPGMCHHRDYLQFDILITS